jgi:apolipoprotein D and lipocalin family protein
MPKSFGPGVIGLLALLASLSGCMGLSSGPPISLAKVDMNRMYGGWYLVATIPNGFEKAMVGPYDVYSKDPREGVVREDFYVRHGSFTAPVQHLTTIDRIRPGTNNAHWRVQIFWPINLPFLILYTDPDYRYVLFGEQNRKLGWVYSRAKTIPDADYQSLLQRFQALGYDPSQFKKYVQTPDQIGQAGVWSDGIK